MVSLWRSNPLARPSSPGIVMPFMLVVDLTLFGGIADAGPSRKVNIRENEKQILDQILGSTYDTNIRPSGANGTGPTIVYVNLFLRSFDKIDDYKMEYSVQLMLRQQWLDERLKFDTINAYREVDSGKLRYLTLIDVSRVWKPDLFFSNEKQSHIHNLLQPNAYVRIFPDGHVLYSIRISLTLSCPMTLKRFPMDQQTCSMRIASYGWTTEDIIFKWKKADPVQVTSDIYLPRFTLENFSTDYCGSQENTGAYSCLRADFVFKRDVGYYMLRIYIPSIILVVASWISFWLDQSATLERVSLGVTLLLMGAIHTAGQGNVAPVAYTKSLDLWATVCLAFVFAAFLEFLLVNYVSRSEREGVNQQGAAASEPADGTSPDHSDDGGTTIRMRPVAMHPSETIALNIGADGETKVNVEPNRGGWVRAWLSKFSSPSKRIDLVSRILFPFLFVLFNISYWS